MSRCPACGNQYRSGTIVTFIDPSSTRAQRAKVCKPCAQGGIVIVAQRVPTPEPKGRQYTWTEEKNNEAIRKLRTYAKLARATAVKSIKYGELEDGAYHGGRAEGFEGAIELLKGPK